jgi:xylulokinase
LTLVAGVDSSTQSCKVVVCDARTGQIVRFGSAPHPTGTEVAPKHWLSALEKAIHDAGGLSDVSAVSIAGQQHGMVLLDENGEVVRDALLWNDTRSADSASELVAELESPENSGEHNWAHRTGVVPVASFTAAKLRWVARNEPENMKMAAAVCLPHDWLTWKLALQNEISELRTDRSDASGTAYFSLFTGAYDLDLLEMATLGKKLSVPKILEFDEVAFQNGELRMAPGMGDNAAAALGVGISAGDTLMSVGTSAVVTKLSKQFAGDPSGIVAGFASALPNLALPLACTLNGAELFDSYAKIFSVSHDELSNLALSAEPGAGGIVTVPYFNGERTPNLPNSTGHISGLTLSNFTAENMARSLFEGILCGLADALQSLPDPDNGKIFLVGGAAKSKALREIAPMILGRKVLVPEPGEYVALGAAKQAAACLGISTDEWESSSIIEFDARHQPWILERYQGIARQVADI